MGIGKLRLTKKPSHRPCTTMVLWDPCQVDYLGTGTGSRQCPRPNTLKFRNTLHDAENLQNPDLILGIFLNQGVVGSLGKETAYTLKPKSMVAFFLSMLSFPTGHPNFPVNGKP